MTVELCQAALNELSCTKQKGHRLPEEHYDRRADTHWNLGGIIRFTNPVSTDDVTEEMVEIVSDIVNGWYAEGRIDWDDVWDRAEDSVLADGSRLDLSTPDLSLPPFKKLKREALKRRAE
ncbi:hypothetical protein [Streptomyces sp. NPDC088727]|uniref:hypothetical protein n=1 Tax=Streptomyces sp. NPDC088727 TaxID=3365875 RepID=UPI003808B8BB